MYVHNGFLNSFSKGFLERFCICVYQRNCSVAVPFVLVSSFGSRVIIASRENLVVFLHLLFCGKIWELILNLLLVFKTNWTKTLRLSLWWAVFGVYSVAAGCGAGTVTSEQPCSWPAYWSAPIASFAVSDSKTFQASCFSGKEHHGSFFLESLKDQREQEFSKSKLLLSLFRHKLGFPLSVDLFFLDGLYSYHTRDEIWCPHISHLKTLSPLQIRRNSLKFLRNEKKKS